MKYTIFFTFALFLLLSCSREQSAYFTPTELKCNNLENPAGTGSKPVFSWIILSSGRGAMQSACQVVLDTDPGKLEREAECYWDSGKISAPGAQSATYRGPDLLPGTRYFWRVKVWDQNGKPSGWSGPSFFITGLFSKDDWKGAGWIGYEEIPESLRLVPGVHGNGNNLEEVALKRSVVPLFRKEFPVEKKVVRALAFISGLGHYELLINGEKQGDRFLSPGWTNYEKTCYYNTFDITQSIRRGLNVIGVITGNGFYNINRERYRKLVIAYGFPRLIMMVNMLYSDGTEENIVTDDTWKCSPSPITFSGIYGGEDYDARLEQEGWDKPGFDESAWKQVINVKAPAGDLKAETDYPLKIMQTFGPIRIWSINDTSSVYDFGQNASGIIRLTVNGKKGESLRLIPGELIGKDSLVTQSATGSPYLFNYTLKGGKEEVWMPRFTYYGFRYVQVEGAVPAGKTGKSGLPVITGLQMLHTRNSSPATGSFRCSNELFNKIYDLINWSIRSNLASVATDCPHREKLGWLEQTHLMGNSIKCIYDIRNLYNKIIDDMIEAQLENGLVPDIAPEYVPFVAGFRDSPEWGSASVILPWDMYEWYGDTSAVRKAYPMMKKYVNYLKGMSEGLILSHGLGDWYDLGPEFPGEAQLTPKAVTATSIFFYDARLLSEMAAIIGEDVDSHYYASLAEEIRSAFNKEFFNQSARIYSTGSQTSMAMPLFFGIVDSVFRKDVQVNLVRSVRANGNALTAGDIGYRYLLRALEEAGESQLIFEMNSRSDVPGYGFQLSKGATSLTESWAGLPDVSNNHMMLGHLMEWFFSGIGGIKQVPGSKAYEHILIAPDIVGDLTWAETTFGTIHGPVGTSWKLTDGTLTLKVSIPVNCRATIKIPCADADKITENNIQINRSESVKVTGTEGKYTICEVSSGEYTFVARVSVIKRTE